MNRLHSKIAVLALCVASFFSFSCATKAPIDISKEFPMAIVSVSSNTTIPWFEADKNVDEDEKINEDGLINSMLNKSINAKNPEINSNKERIEMAEDKLTTMLINKGNFKLIDKETVLNNSTYKSVSGGLLDFMSASCIPEGYKKLSPDSRKMARMIMDSLKAKSLMYVTFQFEKEKSHSKVYARTTMSVRVLNNKGKMVVRKDFIALSANAVQMYGNSYDKDSLVALFPESIEAAVNKFIYSVSLGDMTALDAIEIEEATPIKINRPKTTESVEENAESENTEATTTEVTETTAEKNISDEKINMAKKMLARGMSAEEVSEITELPLEEVKALQDSAE